MDMPKLAAEEVRCQLKNRQKATSGTLAALRWRPLSEVTFRSWKAFWPKIIPNKSNVYPGTRLLATIKPSGNTEAVQFHHPDRHGTKVITNPQNTSFEEQTTLPFGTVLKAETGEGAAAATNRKFTTYERSTATGLGYAVKRSYDPPQGRFTQVDALGTGAVSPTNPQTWNLYAYCGNDPVNHTDPDGQFFGALFGFLAQPSGSFHARQRFLMQVSLSTHRAAVVKSGYARYSQTITFHPRSRTLFHEAE
jgi:RHS repeat-associated protein